MLWASLRMTRFVDCVTRRKKQPLILSSTVKHSPVGGLPLWYILTQKKLPENSLVKLLLNLTRGRKLFAQEWMKSGEYNSLKVSVLGTINYRLLLQFNHHHHHHKLIIAWCIWMCCRLPRSNSDKSTPTWTNVQLAGTSILRKTIACAAALN